jgi:hypothetical protein
MNTLEITLLNFQKIHWKMLAISVEIQIMNLKDPGVTRLIRTPDGNIVMSNSVQINA